MGIVCVNKNVLSRLKIKNKKFILSCFINKVLRMQYIRGRVVSTFFGMPAAHCCKIFSITLHLYIQPLKRSQIMDILLCGYGKPTIAEAAAIIE